MEKRPRRDPEDNSVDVGVYMLRVGCSRLMVTTDGHGRGWTCVVDWPA